MGPGIKICQFKEDNGSPSPSESSSPFASPDSRDPLVAMDPVIIDTSQVFPSLIWGNFCTE